MVWQIFATWKGEQKKHRIYLDSLAPLFPIVSSLRPFKGFVFKQYILKD